MPTYEYRCPEGHHFERFAKMSEAAAELPCPECGKLAARQLSGGAGLVFKGSGFYLTDYGKNAHRKGGPEGATKGESSSGESKPEKSAETKGGDAKPAESKASDAKPAESSSSKGSEKTTSASSSSSTPKKSDA
jgi:putative FmdB family regulatory protein